MVASGWVMVAGGDCGFSGLGLLWVRLAEGDCGFALEQSVVLTQNELTE